MVLLIDILLIIILSGTIFWLASLLFASLIGAPTVYAAEGAIRDAFKLASLRKGEMVVDLGCGNARSLIMAARQFGASGIGVERSPYAYLAARFNVWRSGAGDKIKIKFGDFKKAEADLKQADVVYVYLLNGVLRKIEPWLFGSIQNKTRLVSLAFCFNDHSPKEIKETINLGRRTTIRLYKKNL